MKKNRQEQKRKRNTAIVGLLMVFLMVFSILAFSLDGSSRVGASFDFNDFRFNQVVIFEDQFFFQEIVKYSTKVEGEEVLFFFHPASMSVVNDSSTNLVDLSSSAMLLFSRKPLSESSEFNINLFFFDALILELNKYSFRNMRYGVLEYSSFEPAQEVINCDLASRSTPVFILSGDVGSPSIFEVSDYCYELRGEGDNFFYLSDYLLYKLHKVI